MILLLICHHQSHISQNSDSRWAKMFLANEIVGSFRMQCLTKEVNDEVFFWHADKY